MDIKDTNNQQPTGFRRKVYYIPGYDPFHPRRYRELYRSEGADQAKISDYSLNLVPKKTPGSYGWHIDAVINGQASAADVEVLVWSDIVKSSMNQGITATYLQLLRTAWTYIGSGALFRLMRLRKGPMIAALYPIVFLIFQLILACLAGWGLGTLLSNLVHPLAGTIAGGAVIWLMLRLFRRWDKKVFAYYLMHDYAYTAQDGGANPPELEARMAAFRQAITESLSEGYDEVLVVGHSSGAHLAISIIADILREGRDVGPTALSFLSLGQVVPMVSFLPRATRLRADLRSISTSTEITWVDVTAPGDGCSFALCDPVAVSGVAPEGQIWPLVVSAAFTKSLTVARWNALRWKFFRLHFQYLCAFDRPQDYDYFQITAGAETLGARFGGRVASKSRIVTPTSGYTTVA
ncbi:MAG: hypothetical protein ACEQSU_15140 [Microgenomates group bacterium]